MSASPFEAKLEAKYRKLKQRAVQLEEERDAAEEREQRLRDTLEEEISRALVRRSKSLTEKVKAAEASTSRARKESSMLKKELRDTHEMFKIKLNKERNVKMTEVSRNEKVHSQLETAKKAISRLKSTLAIQEQEYAEHKETTDSLLSQAQAELRLQAAKIEEMVVSHKEELTKEKEARFAAEAKKRTALHKLRDLKEKLAHSIEDRSKNDLRFSQLHERLSKATAQGKQRLAMVKTAQSTVKKMQEQCDKTVAAKEKEFKTEMRGQKQKISSLEAEKRAIATKFAAMKETIEAEKSKDEEFRRERIKIEEERDEAKSSIEKYVDLAERCQHEVAIAEDKIIVMNGKLEDSRKWRHELDLKIDDLEGKLTLQEIRYASLAEQLDEKQSDYNELKEALAKRGISLDFVLQTAKTHDAAKENAGPGTDISRSPARGPKLPNKSKSVTSTRRNTRYSESPNTQNKNITRLSLEELQRSRDGPTPEDLSTGVLWKHR
jgi:hypothetical protein